MIKYDLSKKLAENLDRHLMLPIIEFFSANGIFSEEDLFKARLELLSKTNMLDHAIDLYCKHYNTKDVPKEMSINREHVFATMRQLDEESKEIMSIFGNPNIVKEFRQDKVYNLRFLERQHNFNPESLNILFKVAKFKYQCGDYAGANDLLACYRVLSTDPEMDTMALWGKLAAAILSSEFSKEDWENVIEEVNRLREAVDAKGISTPAFQLKQRTWLIHWALYLVFASQKGLDAFIDLLMMPQYLQTIQMAAPHMLRYLATAVVANKRRHSAMAEVIRLIQVESYEYQDPITEFLECLFIHYDFDRAQVKLRECENVLANDYFLERLKDSFIENARLFIFETYCRAHQVIGINALAQKLNMEAADAEKWVVNLIRNARLDAKIDSKENQVIMGIQQSNTFQQIIEKTKSIASRSQALAGYVDKLDSLQSPFVFQ